MKLEEVSKSLKVSIESDELNIYVKALNAVLVESVAIEKTDAIKALKNLLAGLVKIQQDARDY